MTRKNYMVGIDVGTTQVRVIVGEPRPDGTVGVVGLGISPSEGMKKGVVVDLEKTIASIEHALEEAERMVGINIDSAYVALSGLNTEIMHNRGVVAASSEDREIRADDVERVLQAAQVIALPPDREIVNIVPTEYVVDGYDGIRDPIGMLGVRLEVETMIITSPITSLRNLTRCINRAGIEIKGLVLQSLAAAQVCLSNDEKELGVFLVDIGGGITEISLFEQGKLRRLSAVPVGGDHITSDLAVGLKTSFMTAENLKLEHGCARMELAGTKADIEVRTVGGKEKRLVSEQELTQFIEPRVQEILQIVSDEISKTGRDKLPPAGLVLCGGVSTMPGLLEQAGLFFNEEDVRPAELNYAGIQNPSYAAAVGMLNYVYKLQPGTFREQDGHSKKMRKPGFFQRVRNWFGELIE